MGVKVVCDSAADLPHELAAEHGITVVPLMVRFGEESFVDGVDLTPKEFWSRCAASPVLPETSAPSAGAFETAFRGLAGNDGVVCLTMSSDMSATHQAAVLAAKAVADVVEVRVVDTRTTSMGEGLVALACAAAASAGRGIDEVLEVGEDATARGRLFACLDTLENLKKGGRIGTASALVGGLLSIKPIIQITDGKVAEESKPRTRTRALRHLIELVAGVGPIDKLAVMHAEAPDLEEFFDMLAEVHPRDQVIVGDIGSVVGAHVGPRTLGVTLTTAG
jgi:DegV family protein with EDD domain